MKVEIYVEVEHGGRIGVEGEVKTLADVRRLLRKADVKIAGAVKSWPETGEWKVVKVRAAGEKSTKQEAGA